MTTTTKKYIFPNLDFPWLFISRDCLSTPDEVSETSLGESASTRSGEAGLDQHVLAEWQRIPNRLKQSDDNRAEILSPEGVVYTDFPP